MTKSAKVCILRTAGINCDKETAFAFKKAGGVPEFVHINRLINQENNIHDYHILAIPGGFSYGDDIASGKIFANELKNKLGPALKKFVNDGKLIIGICNGFQVLVKSGLLPGNETLEQETSLIINDVGKFQDCWVYLRLPVAGCRSPVKCVWTKDLPEIIYLPVAHGEGKFVVKDKAVLEKLKKNHQIVFQYCDDKAKLSGYPYNPNGSVENIAGICDETGHILGLMPHPERHAYPEQHPNWTDIKTHSVKRTARNYGDGLQIFKNGVEYVRRTL